MKWSQGLCAAILLDGFYAFSPRAKLRPRQDQESPDGSPDALRFSNALAPDWGLPSAAAGDDHEPPARRSHQNERLIVSHHRLVADLPLRRAKPLS